MKEVNLNIDHWSMVTDHEPAETVYIHADLISLLDDISNANTDGCELQELRQLQAAD